MRLAIVASLVMCLRKWKQEVEKDGKMGVMERKEGGEKEEAGPATMTSRAVNVGMSDGWVERCLPPPVPSSQAATDLEDSGSP